MITALGKRATSAALGCGPKMNPSPFSRLAAPGRHGQPGKRGGWVSGGRNPGRRPRRPCPYMFSSMCIFAISSSLRQEGFELVPLPLSLTEASGASRSQREQQRDGAGVFPRGGLRSRFSASVICGCFSPSFLFPCFGREMRPLPLRKGQRCRVRARSALGRSSTSPQPSLSRTWPVLQTRTVARAPVSAGSSYCKDESEHDQMV